MNLQSSKENSGCLFQVPMINRLESITMLSSNQGSPWEPALPNKVEPALELFTHRKISLTSGNCICSTNILEKKCGRQAEFRNFSLLFKQSLLSISSTLVLLSLFFYNESTNICLILMRCRNYVPCGIERLVEFGLGVWFTHEPGRRPPKGMVVGEPGRGNPSKKPYGETVGTSCAFGHVRSVWCCHEPIEC